MDKKVIALTGGIGCGKSAVASILRNLGYATVDCDQLAKQVANDDALLQKVQKLLGNQSVVDGKLNRRYVRQVVFADGKLLQSYERLFFDGVRRLLDDAVAQSDKTIFVEIALIDAFDYKWDEVWQVTADESTQLQRVTTRDNVDEENVRNVMDKQRFNRKPTRVVYNDGGLDQLQQAVMVALQQSNILQ